MPEARMTKARTKAEKLRDKRKGRPCKADAARTKSGRISYAQDPAEAPDVLARRKRVELYGGEMDGAGDQIRGSVIGRLKISKEISEQQYGALQRYFELHERFFSSIQAPDSLRNTGGGSAMRIPDDSIDINLKEKWKAIREVISDAQKYHNGNILAALQFIVVKDEFHEHMIGDVRIAANALARHYQIS